MESLVVWYMVCDDLNFLSYVLSFCLRSTLWEMCWLLCEGVIFFFSKHLPHCCSTIYWTISHPEISVVDLYLLCWSLAPEGYRVVPSACLHVAQSWLFWRCDHLEARVSQQEYLGMQWWGWREILGAGHPRWALWGCLSQFVIVGEVFGRTGMLEFQQGW